MRYSGIEIFHRAPHVLLRKWIVARVNPKTPELIERILWSLSGQSGCARKTSPLCSMAPGTIARRGEFPRRRGGDGSKGTDEQECYFESHQRPHLGSCVESVVSRLVALVVRFSKTEGIGVAGTGYASVD